MKIDYKILLVFVLIGFFSSCKTTKTLPATDMQDAKNFREIVKKVQNAELHFRTANISKMSLAFEMGDRKVNVNATCKISNDSLIHLSIQPFMGIEMFKAELTPDSIKVYDKMNNHYYFLDYSFFSTKFGLQVDFYSLQSLIVGQLFCMGEKEVKMDQLKLVQENNGQKKIAFENAQIYQFSTLSNDFNILQVLLQSKINKYELTTNYSNYTVQEGFSYPREIYMKASNNNRLVVFDMSILRVEFNVPLKLSSVNYRKFSKGNIDQLLSK